jgi:hypothetical protein
MIGPMIKSLVLSAFGSQKLGGVLARANKEEPDHSAGVHPSRKGNTGHRQALQLE